MKRHDVGELKKLINSVLSARYVDYDVISFDMTPLYCDKERLADVYSLKNIRLIDPKTAGRKMIDDGGFIVHSFDHV